VKRPENAAVHTGTTVPHHRSFNHSAPADTSGTVIAAVTNGFGNPAKGTRHLAGTAASYSCIVPFERTPRTTLRLLPTPRAHAQLSAVQHHTRGSQGDSTDAGYRLLPGHPKKNEPLTWQHPSEAYQRPRQLRPRPPLRQHHSLPRPPRHSRDAQPRRQFLPDHPSFQRARVLC